MTNEEIISSYRKEIARLKEQIKKCHRFFKIMESNLKFMLIGCNACSELSKDELVLEFQGESKD